MKKILKIALIVALIFTAGFAVTKTVVAPRTEVAYAAVYKQGSRGDAVKTIQKKLKNWGYYSGPVDGIYGDKTFSAVKSFQRKNNLQVDGIAGKSTLAALGISSSSSSFSLLLLPRFV